MRLILATIVGLGVMAGASVTPALAGVAPGPGAKAAIAGTPQVDQAGWRGHHHHGGFGFGGLGLYVGPGWGGYYDRPYYSYSDDDYYDYPRYRYYSERRWRHRHYNRRYRDW